MAQESEQHARWRYAFEALLKDAPQNYAQRLEYFIALRHCFHEELGVSLHSALQQYFRSQPKASMEDKIALANRINEDLRRTGIAILCPDTDKPARLAAFSDKDDPDGKGCFGLEVRDDKGNFVRSSLKTCRSVFPDGWMLADAEPATATAKTLIWRDSRPSRGR